MIHLIKTFRNTTLIIQGLVSLVSLGIYFLTSHILEKSYVLSKFPVTYFEQQTSFDALKMKEWYAYMIEQGTFDIYLKTQFIDFAFIAAVILAGFVLWSFIANLHPNGSFFERWGHKMAFALPFAGAFDIFENLVSFFMIANPDNFAAFIVIPYSAFAVLKFACWTVGLIWLVIALLSLPITRFQLARKLSVAGLFLFSLSTAFTQTSVSETQSKELIYVEADPLAYINKGYSIHLGYENWGWRIDVTKVKVDFPERFEEAFYDSRAFDLVSNINGFKIDYIGNRSNWSKNAFVGIDINHQNLSFEHRETGQSTTLNTLNIGVRIGNKIPIWKGFYVTPWAAIWRNVSAEQTFSVANDQIHTNTLDWIATIHFGYAIKL